jgi:DUF1680 family protein
MRTPTAVRIVTSALLLCSLGAAGARGSSAEEFPNRRWNLPDARDVQLRGPLRATFDQCVRRLGQDPYRSLVYLRSDLSFEMKRSFTNYSGDISGRFLEVASLTSPPGRMAPETLPGLLRDIAGYQKADGHFGRVVDWNTPLEPERPDAVILPIFWGNARLLVGLLEAHRASGRQDLLECARRLGDFYVATADRFLDPEREKEYRATGTYAAGYVTDYFPAIEGLVRLYQVTKTDRYLHQAERMAAFFQRFDHLPIDHSHGNLITHHGLVLLYEVTGKGAYLQRVRDRWRQAWDGGYVWPTGGVGERFHVASSTDEGCSEADWLRLNLDLWRVTGDPRFLEAADRLLCNHYEMNRTANGGFGHHQFVCDNEGPLLMKPEFTEAVWCCTFHGLLGLHTLRSYLVVGSESGVFINFPIIESAATVRAGHGAWNVTVRRDRDEPQAITCRVRVDAKDAAATATAVFLRKPDWADQVRVADRGGRVLEAPLEGGYLRLPVSPGQAGEVAVTFSFALRVEDRRLQRISLDPQTVTRRRGVVLRNGPWVLLAPAARPRPVIVLSSRDGRMVFPRVGKDGASVATASGVDATDESLREALRSGARLTLAPWHQHPRDRNAALVFDMTVLPESK